MNKFFTLLITDFKKHWHPCSTGFIIPFLYLLLTLAEYIYTYPINDPTYHPILFTSCCAFFIFLPIMTVIIFITPDKWLESDNHKIAQTLKYMAIWSWICTLFYLLIGTRIAELLIPMLRGCNTYG